jgi:hypothetical protein
MSNLSGSSLDSRCSSEDSQKKCVHFNNQVIRNTFKTGSTVAGMRKPGHSSKKKNKRKRTVSDPSHDSGADALSLKETIANKANAGANAFRARSVSESSDDNRSSDHACSNESVNEESGEESKPLEKQQQSQQNGAQSNSSKKKKKKKNNKSGGNNNCSTSNDNNKNQNSNSNSNSAQAEKKEENPFTVETMLEWKNQGRLGTDDQNGHVTKCNFNFKNKIIDQLD